MDLIICVYFIIKQEKNRLNINRIRSCVVTGSSAKVNNVR
jgi:hypothetical protein